MDYCNTNLQEIKLLLSNINSNDYTKKLSLLSDATIGQHVRHILEFYLCLIEAQKSTIVNYDNRKRNLDIESNINCAINQIDWIIQHLKCESNSTFTLSGNYGLTESANINIPTTYQRELAYCLEHSIHHQALIKVGLKELELEGIINNNFGVAPATIRYKNQCAQ